MTTDTQAPDERIAAPEERCLHERHVFDRSVCACGSMHYYCLDCEGAGPIDECPYQMDTAVAPA